MKPRNKERSVHHHNGAPHRFLEAFVVAVVATVLILAFVAPLSLPPVAAALAAVAPLVQVAWQRGR